MGAMTFEENMKEIIIFLSYAWSQTSNENQFARLNGF